MRLLYFFIHSFDKKGTSFEPEKQGIDGNIAVEHHSSTMALQLLETELDSGNGLAGMFSNVPSKPDGDSNATGNDREGNMWDELEVQEVWVLTLVANVSFLAGVRGAHGSSSPQQTNQSGVCQSSSPQQTNKLHFLFFSWSKTSLLLPVLSSYCGGDTRAG